MNGPTFEILRVDGSGHPRMVKCAGCDEIWVQPSNDPTSETLSKWAGAHVCTPTLFAVGR